MAGGRTIFVGDVHGCVHELARMLEQTGFAQGVDRLMLVGDLVARGPDSAGTVALAKSVGALSVRGNHDERVLSWWRVAREKGRREASKKVKISDRHLEAVKDMREEHFAWLEALPMTIAVPTHGVRVAHAGLDPRVPIDRQDPHLVMNIRSLDEGGTATRKLTGTPWARMWQGPEHVVFGHDARRHLQIERFATGLDTGCCYGRELTALVLAEGEPVPVEEGARRAKLVSVPAARAYCPMGDGQGPE